MEKDRVIKQSNVFIGKYFTNLRIEHRYTQDQLCDILGIQRVTYSKYERGTRGLPLSLMKKLCTLYHLDFIQTFSMLDKELEKQGLYMYE